MAISYKKLWKLLIDREMKKDLMGIGIVKKCAVRKHSKSKIGMYQAT